MPIASVTEFVNALRDSQLLDAGQWEELTQTLQGQCETPQQLSEQLVERNWLTAYQAEQVLKFDGADLKLGPYRLLEKLGEGGMGQVYKAVHQRLQRTVALKVIREERLLRDPDAVHRFQREAQAAAQVSHPNIVLTYDADKVGDTHFIAMEYVDGIDLAKLIKKSGPLPIPQACDYIRQAALGLQHAHESGLVHRDIKPSNLLVTTSKTGKTVSGFFRRLMPGMAPARTDPAGMTPTPVVKILDLGLARQLSKENNRKSQSFLTEDGAVLGTPDFIAPEQARNAHNVDIRADLYSLGCTLYYLLAGRPPFPDGAAIEKMLKHQLDQPTPIQELRPEVSDAVRNILAKLMAKTPEKRFQTPEELVAALDGVTAFDAGKAADRPSAAPAAPPAEPKPRTAWPTLVTTARNEGAPIALEKRPQTTAVVAIEPLPADQTLADDRAAPLEPWGSVGKHKGPVLALAFSERSGLLATGGVDGAVRLWDLTGSKPREHALLEGHRSDVGSLAFAPDGPALLASASGNLDGAVCLWDLAAAKPVGKSVLRGHNSPVTAMAFAPDGSFLSVACNDRSVHLWDLNREEPRERNGFRTHGSFVKSLAVAPDSKTIASGGEDGIAHLLRRGLLWTNHLAQLPVHLGPILSIAFSPDGTILATGSMDRSVWLGDLSGERPKDRALLEGHLDMVRVVQFSLDGRFVFSIGSGVKVVQWDVATAALVREWQISRTLVVSVALSRDGRILAIGNNDGTVSLFRLRAS